MAAEGSHSEDTGRNPHLKRMASSDQARMTKSKERKLKHDKIDSSAKFVSNLLSGMTLEEKIGQMAQVDIGALLMPDPDPISKTKTLDMNKTRRYIGELGVGSVLNSLGLVDDRPLSAAEYRQISIQLQEVAKEYGRPPVIWGLDSVHGANYIRDATWTPSPLNLAATFDRSHAYAAGQWASQDTRAAGITWLFSPLLGLALDSAFARVYETFGEDPYWVGEMAAAMIQGIEESATAPDNSGIPSRAAASAKHFVGYPLPRTGHDRAPSWIPTRHLYQYFVLPWIKVTKNTNIKTVMESYTETDGVPNVANAQHLRYLLRYRLQFEGVLVTDYAEINNLNGWHHIVDSVDEATKYALRQGTVDMSMVPFDIEPFISATVNSVRTNQVSEVRIHESARRVLQLKYELNMFNEDMTMENAVATTNKESEALTMAKDSLILTENKNNLLPLKADQNGLKLLVTGPASNSRIAQTGGWTVAWQGPPNEEKSFTTGSTVYQAFQQKVGQGVFTKVVLSCGTDFLGGECSDDSAARNSGRHLGFLDSLVDLEKDVGNGIGHGINDVGDWVGWNGHSSDKEHDSIDRAIDAAQEVDLVLICIGEEAYAEKPGDIRSQYLPLGQIELVNRMRRSYPDKPIILVYFGGRPRLLQPTPDLVNAVIVAFLPGPHAGEALSDLVVGEYSPSGRLPITYPLSTDGGGAPYFHTISDQCTAGDGPLPHWQYVPCDVQWPFGHGLSYVDFEYSQLMVTGNILTGVNVRVNVANNGDMASSEVVMVFTFDNFRLTTPEYKRLRAVQKVNLKPGESKTLDFYIDPEDLKFVGPTDDRHYITDPTMSFWVGIGPDNDCRAASGPLCALVEPALSKADKYMPPACQAACDLWMHESHSCASHYGLSSTNTCLSLCQQSSDWPVDYISVGMEGWGWNYVNCLESVLWGFQESGSVDCASMTRICRDVFVTQGLNEFGLGASSVHPSQIYGASPSNASIAVALFTGLLASALIVLNMRGISFVPYGKQRARTTGEDLDFSHTSGDEMEFNAVEMFSYAHKAVTDAASDSVLSTPSQLLERIEQHKRKQFASAVAS